MSMYSFVYANIPEASLRANFSLKIIVVSLSFAILLQDAGSPLSTASFYGSPSHASLEDPISPVSYSSAPQTPPAIPIQNIGCSAVFLLCFYILNHRTLFTQLLLKMPDSSVSLLLSLMLEDRPTYHDFGDLTEICTYCGALFWYEERCWNTSCVNHPKYSLWCQGGHVVLPHIQPTPPLSDLLHPENGPDSKHFIENIHMYNSMFAFTSIDVQFDDTLNFGGGPYVFKVSGQVCHLIGSLLPPGYEPPTFAQFYMYDTENEISNCLGLFSSADCSSSPRFHIVQALKDMLDQYNPYVQAFRSVHERNLVDSSDTLPLRIAAHRIG